MLEGLLRHKKEEKDYLCALVVASDRIDGALWETTKDGKVTILKTAEKIYEGEWEEAIDAADQVVSNVEEAMPESHELTKVVFGLFPEWLSEDHIKETHLKHLKQLTSALSLTPVGFVELPLAIAHLLQKDEGTQQTVILVGVEDKQITVSLFKIGKLVASSTLPRSEAISADIEKALTSFADIEVLPSRVLLYGSDTNLETLKTELLNYPWQKKANFLHFPKIEALPADFPVKAVAIASASEITGQMNQEVNPEEVTKDTETLSENSDEVATIAQDLGFSTETTATETKSPSVNQPQARFTLPSLPKMELTFKLPRIPKIGMVVVVVLLLLFLLGGSVAATWFLPKATVKILVKAQTLDKIEQITVDPGATSADPDKKVLPGKILAIDITGSDTLATTGKKTVGDKARGEVTVYNKTLNPKTFKKGTILASGKLKFTLDDDVSIASASEGLGTLTYGTAKTNITASEIGTSSNVGAGTDFTFADLPSTSYSARNEKALSGGTSRDIQVVARDDQKSLREKTLAKLKDQIAQELKQKLASTEKLLEESITTDVKKETFNKEIGEESDTLSLETTLSSQAFTYNETDFFSFLDRVMSSSVPSGFEYKKEDVKLAIDKVSDGTGEAKVFTTHLTTQLLPKIDTNFSRELAGKSIKDATTFLSNQQAVAGVEFDVKSLLPWGKNQLPLNSANIHIVVSTL